MGDAAEKSDEADRLERLIASNEHAANALNRLVQLLERKETAKRVKAARTRPAPQRKVAVTDRAVALAKAAIARHRDQG